jgi:hypothetical protein
MTLLTLEIFKNPGMTTIGKGRVPHSSPILA